MLGCSKILNISHYYLHRANLMSTLRNSQSSTELFENQKKLVTDSTRTNGTADKRIILSNNDRVTDDICRCNSISHKKLLWYFAVLWAVSLVIWWVVTGVLYVKQANTEQLYNELERKFKAREVIHWIINSY